MLLYHGHLLKPLLLWLNTVNELWLETELYLALVINAEQHMIAIILDPDSLQLLKRAVTKLPRGHFRRSRRLAQRWTRRRAFLRIALLLHMVKF